jgi:hypothetical protein
VTCTTSSTRGITPKTGYAHYTVRQAAEDWLARGLDGRSPKTVKKNQNVLEPILKVARAPEACATCPRATCDKRWPRSLPGIPARR